MSRVAVGVDVGTSAVKVLAVTPDGRQLAISSEFYGLLAPRAGYVEQDAEVVYAATMRVLARVLAGVRELGEETAVIGFSTAMHGLLCVDAQGTPLAPYITWLDQRSAEIADAWRADGTAAALYAETGAPMHPMLPLAKLRWLAEHEADLTARTARFVGLKELFVFRWTGAWLVDWGIASATGMFALNEHRWSERALELARIAPERLSTPAPPSTLLHELRPEIAAALGAPGSLALVLASSDGALATIGSGAGSGDFALTLGTSGAVRRLAAGPALDPLGRTFCYWADDRRFVVGGPTSSAGAALDWVFALLLGELPRAERFARAAALAEEVGPGADGCTVLPFLAGERAPYWQSALRGMFAGLDLTHDRRTLIRAAFEGVVFGLYAVYGVVRERAGAGERLLLSGGLTKAPLVRGLLADVFGLPVVEPHQPEASALGAALLAARSAGLIEDADAVARGLGAGEPLGPDAPRGAAYAGAFDRYRRRVEAELTR